MGIKVSGISQAQKNLNALIGDIQGRKVVRAVQSALIIGGSQAALYTPIDTSMLLNSQFRDITVNGNRVSVAPPKTTTPLFSRIIPQPVSWLLSQEQHATLWKLNIPAREPAFLHRLRQLVINQQSQGMQTVTWFMLRPWASIMAPCQARSTGASKTSPFLPEYLLRLTASGLCATARYLWRLVAEQQHS